MLLLLATLVLAAAGNHSPASRTLATWVASQCDASKVEVQRLGIEPGLLQGDLIFEGYPCRERPELVANIHDGDQTRRYVFKPSLALYAQVAVASEAAAIGQVVPIRYEQRALSTLSGPAVMGPGPWRARTAVNAGTPLTQRWVEAIPDAETGTVVMVQARRGDLLVRAEGRLLQDGQLGASVRARVDATGVVVRGLLIDPTTVELQ